MSTRVGDFDLRESALRNSSVIHIVSLALGYGRNSRSSLCIEEVHDTKNMFYIKPAFTSRIFSLSLHGDYCGER